MVLSRKCSRVLRCNTLEDKEKIYRIPCNTINMDMLISASAGKTICQVNCNHNIFRQNVMINKQVYKEDRFFA